MRLKNKVKLKAKDRRFLKAIISKGVEKARKITRCRILLLSNEGRSDTEIMKALKTARNTIREVRRRYVHEGLEVAINEGERPGAPLKFDGSDRAKITALACSEPPEGRNRWTLRLLADKLVALEMVGDISHQTVKRVLKKTNLNLT